MAERGCGKRKKGGIYAECGLSPVGRPLEDFLIDPPILPNFDVPTLGMKPIQDPHGVVHLVDWVGEEHYPNVWDFIEEVRRMGLSRRVSSSAPLDKLTRQSRILLVHKTAYVHNRAEIPTMDRPWTCPTGKHDPGEVEAMCLGMPLWLVEPREGDTLFPAAIDGSTFGTMTRKMPSFTYKAGYVIGGFEPVYSGAIFASFPISRLAVIAGGTTEEMERAQSALNGAQLPVVELEA